jgi:hypothetical protein
MRDKVRTRQYVMTFHADEERDADKLSILDVEHCILTGTIVERQKDKDTAEWKYHIVGSAMRGRKMEVIGKIGTTDKLVIITVFLSLKLR